MGAIWLALLAMTVLSLSPQVESKIDPSSVSISGFSSGAFFAVQYQVAYSSTLKGAAIFAGGPYYCAQDSLTDAFEMCMAGIGNIPLQQLESDAQQNAQQGLIDGLGNLTKHNVYLYSGTFDTTVNPKVMKQLQQMYNDFKVANISTQFSIESAHTFPTTNYGNLCIESISPYISNCAYDGAGTALQSIYGSLTAPGSPNNNNFVTLDQSKFTPGGQSPSSLSLDQVAYAYVPTGCQNKANTCKLHVVLHGCMQSASQVGKVFVQYAGYNSWAESNNIIVVYPQTIVSYVFPLNPNGCWDWWGYLDATYATRNGPQMQFMTNLVQYVLQNF